MDEDTRARIEFVSEVHELLAGPRRDHPPTSSNLGTPVTPCPPQQIPAPPPDRRTLGDASLAAALRTRRSSYDLTRELPAELLGRVIGAACGAIHRDDGDPRPVSPTAGGLASREVHVLAHRVPGAEGIWQHDPADGVLRRVGDGDGDHDRLAAALDQPPFADAAAVVCLSARLEVGLARYSVRHYRTHHLDAGIALQSLGLAAAALGLPGCVVAGFDDTALDRLLAHPPTTITLALYAVGGPRPAPS